MEPSSVLARAHLCMNWSLPEVLIRGAVRGPGYCPRKVACRARLCPPSTPGDDGAGIAGREWSSHAARSEPSPRYPLRAHHLVCPMPFSAVIRLAGHRADLVLNQAPPRNRSHHPSTRDHDTCFWVLGLGDDHHRVTAARILVGTRLTRSTLTMATFSITVAPQRTFSGTVISASRIAWK